MQEPFEHVVYSKNVLEFVTVAREYCAFVENAGQYSKSDFIEVGLKLLPLLYLKATMLPQVEQQLDEPMDAAVDEFMYTGIKDGIAEKLTAHDAYLEVFHEDIQRSETPIVAYISEDFADIYQDVRNFTACYRVGVEEIMNDAVFDLSEQFRTFWGQKLLNALRALHNIFYSGDELTDEDPAETEDDAKESLMKSNWYSRFQDGWANETV
ncbi:MAG: DUF5063 domain-containing protein [Breznakibacter sp.]